MSLQSLIRQVSATAAGDHMDTDDASYGAVPAEASSAVSASRLSRLFFILGQVAIQHLVSLLQPCHDRSISPEVRHSPNSESLACVIEPSLYASIPSVL